MEEKEAEILFKKDRIKNNSIFQLKDGKLIFYYFIGGYRIILYSQKTFQKLYELNLDELIIKLEEKGKGEFDKEEDEDEETDHKINDNRNYSRNYKDKISIIELDNNLILIGYNKYLIELNYFGKYYSSKILKKFKDIIMDIVELSDERLIIFTNDNIKEIIKNEKKFAIKKKYSFENNWKINPHPPVEGIEYRDFHSYFCSNILPNNKLLLNSFSSELYDCIGCGSHPTEEINYSKIIFLDLKKFEEIASTETFDSLLKYVVLENIIVIQADKILYLYDINSLQSIKKIWLEHKYEYFLNYNKRYLIALSEDKSNNNIEIFKIENNNLIKCYVVQKGFLFKQVYRWWDYSITDYHYNSLIILKDKRIIIIYNNKLYILKINLD